MKYPKTVFWKPLISAYIVHCNDPASKKHCRKAKIYFFQNIFIVSIHTNIVLTGEKFSAVLVEEICCNKAGNLGHFHWIFAYVIMLDGVSRDLWNVQAFQPYNWYQS